MSNTSIRLSQEQINYIVKKTGEPDPKLAIEFFAELMVMERIHPSKMGLVVQKLMERDRKRLK